MTAHKAEENERNAYVPLWGKDGRAWPPAMHDGVHPGAYNRNLDDLIAELVQLRSDGRTLIVRSPPDLLGSGKAEVQISMPDEVSAHEVVRDLRAVLWTMLTAVCEDVQDRFQLVATHDPSSITQRTTDEVVGAAIVAAARRRA